MSRITAGFPVLERDPAAGRKDTNMSGRERSRREFLLKSLTGVGAAWAVANYAGIEEAYAFVQQSAKSGQASFAFFTAPQAAEVEAMAAQIIPTDSTPG